MAVALVSAAPFTLAVGVSLMIGEAARQAGARIIATGETARLGAVEAGGMLRLLAREVPAAQLNEVRRFDAVWERQASVRLRDGDLAAAAAYDRHGRIRGADKEAACTDTPGSGPPGSPS